MAVASGLAPSASKMNPGSSRARRVSTADAPCRRPRATTTSRASVVASSMRPSKRRQPCRPQATTQRVGMSVAERGTDVRQKLSCLRQRFIPLPPLAGEPRQPVAAAQRVRVQCPENAVAIGEDFSAEFRGLRQICRATPGPTSGRPGRRGCRGAPPRERGCGLALPNSARPGTPRARPSCPITTAGECRVSNRNRSSGPSERVICRRALGRTIKSTSTVGASAS